MTHPSFSPENLPWEELTKRAISVRLQAYAPYSKFKVGAALVTSTGEIFTGCNVENASYGLSICAERSALVTCVGQGFRDVLGMVVAAEPMAAPCGACRQFLVQFGGGDMLVRSLSPVAVAAYRQWTTAELLPDRFEF